MSKAPAKSKSAGASTPPAAPAASLAAKATGASTQAEPDFELPSAAEIGAQIAQESDTTDDSAPVSQEEAGRDITPPPSTDGAEDAEAAAEEQEVDTDEPAPEAEPATEEDQPETEATESDEQAPSERYQKRIDELTAARTKAEAEAAQLREQLAAAKQTAPNPLDPFVLVDSEQDLAAAVDREERFMEWVMANEGNPDGADLPDGKGGTIHFDADQIRQMKVNTYRILRTADKRREFIRQRAEREREATAAYPWLKNTKDGLGAELQQVIEARPYLRQSTDYRQFAADAVIGARLRQAGVRLDENGVAGLLKGRPQVRTAAKAPTPGIAGAAAIAAARAGSAPVRRTAPSPSRPGTLPPRITGREAQARQAAKQLSAGDGNLASVEQSIAAKFRW